MGQYICVMSLSENRDKEGRQKVLFIYFNIWALSLAGQFQKWTCCPGPYGREGEETWGALWIPG